MSISQVKSCIFSYKNKKMRAKLTSFFEPTNLTTNKETPNSGSACQAFIKFNLASERVRSLTFA